MRYKKRDPVDYSKCNQYVSVYHADFTQGSITQHNIPFAFFDFRKNENINRTGQTETNTFLLVIPKEKNTIKVTPKKVKVKSKALSKKKVVLARKKVITVKGKKGKLTYALKSVTGKKYKKYFSLNKKTGKLTIKKGLKKGTYKLRIKVTDNGGLSYRKAVKTIKVAVKVR